MKLQSTHGTSRKTPGSTILRLFGLISSVSGSKGPREVIFGNLKLKKAISEKSLLGYYPQTLKIQHDSVLCCVALYYTPVQGVGVYSNRMIVGEI